MIHDFLLRRLADTNIVLPTPKVDATSSTLIQTVLTIVYSIVGALTFLYLVLGGFNS